MVIAIGFSACSKEEEEVTPTAYTSPTFDIGYLKVVVDGQPEVIDSIRYTNSTKGVSNLMSTSQIVYYQFNNTSVYSKAMATGHAGDAVQACVYLSTGTNIGIAFENIPSDSIPTVFVNSNVHCGAGNY